MTDVHRTDGPTGRPDPVPEKKSPADAAKFQEAMRMQKVGETDPDEQKKRKQKEEETEETFLALPEEKLLEAKGPSFLEHKEGVTDSMQSVSETQPSYTPPIQNSEETPYTPPREEISIPSYTTVSQEEGSTAPPPTKKKGKGSLTSQPFTVPPPESLMISEQELAKIEAPKEITFEIAKQKKENLFGGEAFALPLENLSITPPPTPLMGADPFAHLPTAIQEVFNKMVGVMTVMQLTPGIQETSFILNGPQFASSVFFGSQIIIQEFSTAPLMFNVQLNGSQQAVSLFQKNLGDLIAAFQGGQYAFKINRLETGYLKERPLFHRKSKAQEQDSHDHSSSP